MASSRPRARRGASERIACGPSSPAPAIPPVPYSDSKARCGPLPLTPSTMTWRSWRSPARPRVWFQRPSSVASVPGPMAEAPENLVGRLFNAFNQRDAGEIVALCSTRMEFFALTAEEVGRGAPYVGPDGLRDYLKDVEQFWEELLITPGRVEGREDRLLVIGRVFVRNRELGIRDMPVGWIWQVEDGLFVRGEVFADPDEAISRFGAAA